MRSPQAAHRFFISAREHLKHLATNLLFVDGKALGVIGAKKAGVPLSGVEP